MKRRLGVNIDHVATLRQARGESHPDPISAAKLALSAGADFITFHLREDRRHIQDADVTQLKESLNAPLNFELSATADMISFARRIKPECVTIVPEKREELTTEGGLDVLKCHEQLRPIIQQLQESQIKVNLFIDPNKEQILISRELGVDGVEFHTGDFANSTVKSASQKNELTRLKTAAQIAKTLNLHVAFGHGLTTENLKALIAFVPEVCEYNIGHSIISRAIFVGLKEAVLEIKELLAT